ncbi:MAG TPA: divalent-cation tolerance protein CutA [Erythrobacter sp.]|nr:divalent-cation tolerance protein CutA [Erythrobacter sp.]
MSDPAPAAALVWCPFPDADSARTATKALLAERLIACGNLIGPIESHFVWEGQPASSTEIGLLCKTTSDCLAAAIERLGALHPYDTPAIIGWCCDAAHPASMAWLTALCHIPD